MQLYKSRGFSEFFQDTFGFLKLNGKHFFKHYFIITGVFLLILMVMGYFFTKFYSDIIFSGIVNNQGSTIIDSYMNDNGGLIILLGIFVFIIGLIAFIVSYAFTPIYLKLYNDTEGKNFGTKEILNRYKENIIKLVIYVICTFIIFIPLAIVFALIAFVLAITIIGILAIPLLIGAFALFYFMALSEYLENDKGIWDSFGYSWSLLLSKFWAAVGAVGIFYFISYALQYIIQLISSIFTFGSLYVSTEQNTLNPNEATSTMSIFMIVIFFLSFALSTILGNIIQVSQGMVFYGLKEGKENINTKDIIDQIGASA